MLYRLDISFDGVKIIEDIRGMEIDDLHNALIARCARFSPIGHEFYVIYKPLFDAQLAKLEQIKGGYYFTGSKVDGVVMGINYDN